MKKIIAIMFAILTITSLAACGNKPMPTNERENIPVEDKIVETPAPSKTNWIDELDKMVKEYLGDDVLATSYEDDTYYILIAIGDVNSAYMIAATEVDESIDLLSETISDTFDVDCAIFVVDDVTHDVLLYATLNGNDITDYMN